jgi:hypothetical protein
MPRLPIDYSKTIIYKIVCRDLAIKNCYVGHTTDFPNRKRAHKCSCKIGHKQCYVHRFINENGGWENWDMIMVEQCQCTNLYEASARERHWIETLNADLNKWSPATGLSHIEWDKNNYIKNADKIAEYQKQYYAKNADKIIERAKQYNTENADRIKEYQKQYITENADILKDKRTRRVCCIQCKCEISYSSLFRHYKLKH